MGTPISSMFCEGYSLNREYTKTLINACECVNMLKFEVKVGSNCQSEKLQKVVMLKCQSELLGKKVTKMCDACKKVCISLE
jgi:hypothetical protein